MQVAAGTGHRWSVLGEQVTCKALSHDTNGAYSLFEVTSPVGGGAPLHIHHNEDEAFYVLSGELLVQEGDRRSTAPAGTFVLFRKGTAHTYKNAGSTPARLLVIVAPGGYEAFFEAMSKIAFAPESPPDLTAVAGVAGRFDIEIVGPPL